MSFGLFVRGNECYMCNGENTLIYTRIGDIGEENISCVVPQMAGLSASVGDTATCRNLGQPRPCRAVTTVSSDDNGEGICKVR